MDTGNIAPLKLVGYADDGFSKPTGSSYNALINPETFTINYGTQSTPKSGQGSSEEQRVFNKRSAQTVSFKILIDGTGLIPSGPAGSMGGGMVGSLVSAVTGDGGQRDVVSDIAKLKQVVYGYNSDSHQPTYVQIQWGKILFNAQLQSMTLAYKLFSPDGTPKRAEADLSFQGVINDDKLAALENKQSPDLTHVRTVIKGDTLSLICYREYGDSKYYYQVAQINRLTDFKRLAPGMKLILPPIAIN
jgi:nucleoid-associated protein YgaU